MRWIRAALRTEGGAGGDGGRPARELLRTLRFAAEKHRDQRRKGAGAPPFINHAIEVAELLSSVGGVVDPVTLQAAVLHDTLEDTDTTFEEIAREFGSDVAHVVLEVTDEKGLRRDERKRRQVESAAGLSHRARLVRLADKIVNVRAIASSPPVDWSPERRLDYLEWADRVVDRCRGCSSALEAAYDEAIREAVRVVRLEAVRR
jgi:GTP diphosphokinase / guanosine-3',5'-bis(diphosphate) 3'-diphosphatase